MATCEKLRDWGVGERLVEVRLTGEEAVEIEQMLLSLYRHRFPENTVVAKVAVVMEFDVAVPKVRGASAGGPPLKVEDA